MIRYLSCIKLTGLSYTNLAKWGYGYHIRIDAITQGKWASHTDIGHHLRKVVVCELTKKVFVGLRKKMLVGLRKKSAHVFVQESTHGFAQKVFVCLYKKCLCVGEKICRKMVAWFQIYSA